MYFLWFYYEVKYHYLSQTTSQNPLYPGHTSQEFDSRSQSKEKMASPLLNRPWTAISLTNAAENVGIPFNRKRPRGVGVGNNSNTSICRLKLDLDIHLGY